MTESDLKDSSATPTRRFQRILDRLIDAKSEELPARCWSCGDRSRPSAFAVLRLITPSMNSGLCSWVKWLGLKRGLLRCRVGTAQPFRGCLAPTNNSLAEMSNPGTGSDLPKRQPGQGRRSSHLQNCQTALANDGWGLFFCVPSPRGNPRSGRNFPHIFFRICDQEIPKDLQQADGL